MAIRWGNKGNGDRFYFVTPQSTVKDWDCNHAIIKHLLLWGKTMTNLDSILKSRDIPLPTEVHTVKAMVFSSRHVRICELDHKEGWALKNWCFRTRVLEKTPESPMDCKEIQPVSPKENQLWIFTGRSDAEAPILWPPDVTHWKRPWCWERLKAGGEGDDRGWDGWMASPTQWTWVWANSGWKANVGFHYLPGVIPPWVGYSGR